MSPRSPPAPVRGRYVARGRAARASPNPGARQLRGRDAGAPGGPEEAGGDTRWRGPGGGGGDLGRRGPRQGRVPAPAEVGPARTQSLPDWPAWPSGAARPHFPAALGLAPATRITPTRRRFRVGPRRRTSRPPPAPSPRRCLPLRGRQRPRFRDLARRVTGHRCWQRPAAPRGPGRRRRRRRLHLPGF